MRGFITLDDRVVFFSCDAPAEAPSAPAPPESEAASGGIFAAFGVVLLLTLSGRSFEFTFPFGGGGVKLPEWAPDPVPNANGHLAIKRREGASPLSRTLRGGGGNADLAKDPLARVAARSFDLRACRSCVGRSLEAEDVVLVTNTSKTIHAPYIVPSIPARRPPIHGFVFPSPIIPLASGQFLMSIGDMALYRLPFGIDPSWSVGRNCWDGPYVNDRHPSGPSYAWDFGAKSGTPIHAARTGVVTEAVSSVQPDEESFYGNLVRIRHPDGSVAAYFHLLTNEVYVAVGDYVFQGQVIAQCGATGTGSPHLHFEVVYEGGSRGYATMPVTFEDDNHAEWRPRRGDTVASNNSMLRQEGWRWCNKCQGLFFGDNPGSSCPEGGKHDRRGSGNYFLTVNEANGPGQDGWRWCQKCQGLFFGNNAGSRCPTGGEHASSGSANYTLTANDANARGQDGWRWCHKCQGLFYGENPGSRCPTGGEHASTGSGNYRLTETRDEPVQRGWRRCTKCRSLFFGQNPGSRCPADGNEHQADTSEYRLFHDTEHAPGMNGWRWCHRCQGLFRPTWPTEKSRCPAGGKHAAGDTNYMVIRFPYGAQPGWGFCDKCKGLVFGARPPAPCAAGGTHASGGGYMLRAVPTNLKGQSGWRICEKCSALWFGDNAGSKCPTDNNEHEAGSSGNYVLEHNGSNASDIEAVKRTRWQEEWRWCRKCQGLHMGASKHLPDGKCPAGGSHSTDGSGEYGVEVHAVPGELYWRECTKCLSLWFQGPGSHCPVGGAHEAAEDLYTVEKI